jgi:hypothetical protein
VTTWIVVDWEDVPTFGTTDYQEFEVTSKQAASWNRLNEKEQLTLVLKADREGRDVRDYL